MKLTCPECRRENEPERIYCHDCGARLDRSVLAATKSKEEDPKETQRRLRAMLNPRRAAQRQMFFQASKVVLGALLAAAVIQMLRPPELPAATEELSMPPQINLDLENASMNARAGSLRYTEEQVNDYLLYTLKSKQASLSKVLEFRRAVAAFGAGWAELTVERSLFGWPIFTTAGLEPVLKDGTMSGKSRGGSLGRLPVHPALMQYGRFLFGDVLQALDRERRLAAKFGAVEFTDKAVMLTQGPPPQ
ncbi:hypothetical protein BH20VER1_BH20VER1_21510 [soil metagenome]